SPKPPDGLPTRPPDGLITDVPDDALITDVPDVPTVCLSVPGAGAALGPPPWAMRSSLSVSVRMLWRRRASLVRLVFMVSPVYVCFRPPRPLQESISCCA